MKFKDYLIACGLSAGDDVIVHSSYRSIRNEFSISVEDIIKNLTDVTGKTGSLIMPVFTYNFKVKFGSAEPFYKDFTQSKTGIITEIYRKMPDVIRTTSPTHSFAIKGNVTNYFAEENSPESPLGEGSIMEWLANRSTGRILLLGVNFNSLSFGHYLEIKAKIPWFNFSPWEHMAVESVGLKGNKFQNLKEIPGCSKQFIKLQDYLLRKKLIAPVSYNSLSSYYLKTELLMTDGLDYFKNNYKELLCAENNCQACDSRRKKYLRLLNELQL